MSAELEKISTETVGVFVSDKVSAVCGSSCKDKTPTSECLISQSNTSNDDITKFLNKFLANRTPSEAISFIVFYEATDSKREKHVNFSVEIIKSVYKNPNLVLMKLNDGLPDLEHQFPKKILDLFPIKKMIDYDSNSDPEKWLPFVVKNKSLEYWKSIIQKNAAFFSQLDNLAAQAKQLKEDNSEIAAVAEELNKRLRNTWNNFYSNEINFETFKNTCERDIKLAEPKFKNDLSLKTILINIGLAILGLGIFYLAALKFTGKTLFFDNRKTFLTNEIIAINKEMDNLGSAFVPIR